PRRDRRARPRDGNPSPAPPACSPVPGDNHPDPKLQSGNHWDECPAAVKDNAGLLVDPVLALYDGRGARGEAAATALYDRIRDAKIAVRNRLADQINERKQKESPAPMTAEDLRKQNDETRDMLTRRRDLA